MELKQIQKVYRDIWDNSKDLHVKFIYFTSTFSIIPSQKWHKLFIFNFFSIVSLFIFHFPLTYYSDL